MTSEDISSSLKQIKIDRNNLKTGLDELKITVTKGFDQQKNEINNVQT